MNCFTCSKPQAECEQFLTLVDGKGFCCAMCWGMFSFTLAPKAPWPVQSCREPVKQRKPRKKREKGEARPAGFVMHSEKMTERQIGLRSTWGAQVNIRQIIDSITEHRENINA